MNYYYHLEENEIQKISLGNKNKWYIQALQAKKMQLQELIKTLEYADKNNLWRLKPKKDSAGMKLIRIILAYKCVKAMKHKYLGKEHQLAKIHEEEQEYNDATKHARELPKECFRIKTDNFFKWAYKTYVKDTAEEEKSDCFIAWSGMLATDFPKRRTFLMQREYCQNMQDVKHILLKLRYNKLREDWRR